MTRTLVTVFAIAAAFTCARAANADEAGERVHLVVDSAAGCDPIYFSTALGRHVTALDPAWRDLHLEVHVARKGRDFEGRVWASELGEETARRVVDTTCERTLDSLALLAAIALDAASREREEAARAEAPIDVAPEPTPIPTPMPIPSVAATKIDRVTEPAPHHEETPWQPVIGTMIEASSLGYFATPYVGIERRHGVLPLAFKVGAVFGAGDIDPDIPQLHTHSTWKGGRLEGCPVQLEITSSIYARPCLAVDIGQVQTTLVAAQDTTRGMAWVAPRLALRLGWDVVPWLRIEADAAFVAGFSQPEWVADRGFVATTEWPVIALGAGAAVRFP